MTENSATILENEPTGPDVYKELKSKELKALEKLIWSNRLLSFVTFVFVIITSLAVRQAFESNAIARAAVAENQRATMATKCVADATFELAGVTLDAIDQANETHETTRAVLGEIKRIGATFQFMQYRAPKIVKVSASQSGEEVRNRKGKLPLAKLRDISFIWVTIKNEGNLSYYVQPELLYRTKSISKESQGNLIPYQKEVALKIRLEGRTITRLIRNGGSGSTEWKTPTTLVTD